ncbi:MAG: bifunctional metallophosphatase/5'-nucleotidase [Myxococcales bacterium]|nr:MAG: bifunctional metallophosphatase/5'-nucleotidase [Myxococcales bacterium]
MAAISMRGRGPTILIVLFFLIWGACSEEKKSLPLPEITKRQLAILYFGDFHGHLTPFTRFYGDAEKSGGFARLARLIKDIRAKNAAEGVDTLVVSSGDNIQGTPLSTAFRGEAEIAAFNLLGLDASAIGNHEFDFGADRLLQLIEQAKFPFLSASIYEFNGPDLIFKPYLKRKMANGLRVGLIGLTTPETPITTHPANVAAYRFAYPPLSLQRYLPQVQRDTDLVILLSHLGIGDDKTMANEFPGIGVIIGGHTHTLLAEPLLQNGVLIAHAGDRGLYLGRLDVEVMQGRARMISHRLIPIRHGMPEDPEMAALVGSYDRRLSAEIARVVGQSAVFLDGERESVRTQETNLGSLIADLIRLQAEADVAVINSGAIRSSIQPGPVTLGDVISALPMDNHVVRLEVTGEQLLLVLARSIKGRLTCPPGQYFGGFLQVSGLRFGIQNGLLKDVQVNGAPLVLSKTYRLATNDFLAAGGDGYKELKEAASYYDTGVTLRDLFVNFVAKKGVIATTADGRIRFF